MARRLIRDRVAAEFPRRDLLAPALVPAPMVCDLSRATAGRAEQLIATWQTSAATADPTGHLLRMHETTAVLLAACGDEQLPPIGRSQLGLIYDTSADALEVVRARDAVVCSPQHPTVTGDGE